MFTTGSKFLVGGAVMATIAAVAYGITQDGALGTIGLISAAIALAFLAGVNMYVRDSDVSSMDTTALTQSAAAAPVPGPSGWPIVGALGGVLVVVGLVTYPVVFVFGILALLAAAAEWMVQAWSERASADVVFNDNVRSRIAHPLEFPILAAIGAGILIYSFSRIMLFLSKSSGPAVFAAIAALLLAGGFVIAFRPSLRTGAIGVVCVVAALGLVTGGVSAALEGERELHPHETTGALADDGECDNSDETEADEHASQTVAAKANLTAEVILRDDETLVAKNLGVTGEQDAGRRHAGQPDQRAVHQREQRGPPPRPRPRHASRDRRGDGGHDPRHRGARPAVHATRRGRRQPVADVLDRDAQHGRRCPVPVLRAGRRRRRARGARTMSAVRAARRPLALVAAVIVVRRRAPTTPRRTRGSRPVRTPRRSRTCSGRSSSSPASSA